MHPIRRSLDFDNDPGALKTPVRVNPEGLIWLGDRYLRRLLVVGMTSLVCRARAKPDSFDPRIAAMLARKPARVVTVAAANRTARVAWSIMARCLCHQIGQAMAAQLPPRQLPLADRVGPRGMGLTKGLPGPFLSKLGAGADGLAAHRVNDRRRDELLDGCFAGLARRPGRGRPQHCAVLR